MSVDKFFNRKMRGQEYNCLHFAREVWFDLTGVDFMQERHKFKPIDRPLSPCVVYMQRSRAVPHVGIFLRGRVLHLNSHGVEFQPLSVAACAYETVRFYQ